MLYEQGECYPTNQGYTYKLYLNVPMWSIQVFHRETIIGNYSFPMTFEPRCGIDVCDSNIIDRFIDKTIKTHIEKRENNEF